MKEQLFVDILLFAVFFPTTKVVSPDSTDSGRKKTFYPVMRFFLQSRIVCKGLKIFNLISEPWREK